MSAPAAAAPVPDPTGSDPALDPAAAPGAAAEPRTAAEPDAGAPDLPPDAATVPPGRARRRRSRRVLVAALAVVALVLTGGAVAVHARWDARAEQDLTVATDELDAAARRLRSARSAAQDVLAASALRVADDAVRRDLARLLVGAPAVAVAPDGSRAARAAEARRLAVAVGERVDLLVGATGAVRTARAAWDLDRAVADRTAAVDELRVAVETAGAALAATEGRVLDDAPRTVLAAAVAAAVPVRDAPAPTTTADLTAAADEARGHVAALAAAGSAVAEAEAAWQGEQDRQAAAAAAAAARAPGAGGGSAGGSRSTAPGTGSAAGSSTTRPRTSVQEPSGGGGAPSGGGSLSGWQAGDPVPEGYRVEVETQGGAWCGTSLGEVWEC